MAQRFPSPLRLALGLLAALLSASPAGATQRGPVAVHVAVLLRRIGRLDGRLHAVIRTNPDVLRDARACERRPGQPLACNAFLIKDNIQVAGMATTAGSLALVDNVMADAPIVAALRRNGGLVLGKANLSEWANFRSTASISGWSAVGGQSHNPYALNRSPAGSSAGSAVAVAAGLADAALGTDTGGSVTAPSSMNGIVGFKPTIGLVSRTGLVPVSSSQDSAGPMARDVDTVARILDVIAFADPSDPATLAAPNSVRRAGFKLSERSLAGVRLGVLRWGLGYSRGTDALFEQALAALRARGAILIDVPSFDGLGQVLRDENVILTTEFKVGINGYLANTPAAVRTRTLSDLIAFNRAHAEDEMPFFGQEQFERAEATAGLQDPAYVTAHERGRRMAGPEGIDRMLADHQVVALIAPTLSPAFMIDAVNGDHHAGGGEVGAVAAVAGYPHLTLPMGRVRGLPVGFSLIGTAWSDRIILELGRAVEREMPRRVAPTLAPSIETSAAVAQALAPRRRSMVER